MSLREKPAVKAVILRTIDGEPHFFYQEKRQARNFQTSHPHRADLPGGGVEAGETRETAVLREVEEETGLQVKHIRQIREWRFERPDKGDVLVGTTHLCEYLSGEHKLSEELESGGWRKVTDTKGLPQWLIDDLKAARSK